MGRRKSSLYLTSTQRKKRFRRRLKLFFAMAFLAAVVVSVIYFDEIKSTIMGYFTQSEETSVADVTGIDEEPLPSPDTNTEREITPAPTLPPESTNDEDEITSGKKDETPETKESPTPAPTKKPKPTKPPKPKFSFRYDFGKVVDGEVVDVDSDYESWIVHKVLTGKRLFDPYEEEVKKLAKKIKSFKKQYITSKMSAYDKARAIHDYLVRNVHYSYVRRRERRSTRKYDAYGALINHEAVCAGYAKAFELMCACCEVKCHFVEGEATNNHGTDDHAWNMIKTGGKWRHVDVTWDDPTPERYQNGIEHTYFNVTDRFISRDHTWERRDYPKCR